MTTAELAPLAPEIIEQQEAERVLEEARREIDEIDQQRIALLARRLQLGVIAGEAKRALKRPVYNGQRENEVVSGYIALATELGVPRELALGEITSTITVSRNMQMLDKTEV